MILNHFVTASFNNAIYLQVTKHEKNITVLMNLNFYFMKKII